MGTIIASEFMTLDGVIQAPGGAQEDTENGFPYGGWQGPYFDGDSAAIIDALMKRINGLLLGRVTYEIFAGYWPQASEPEAKAMADLFNRIPKYVVSATLKHASWRGTTVLKNTAEVAEAKNQTTGNLVLFGSSKLVQSLLKENLIDEYILWLYPLVLGKGKKLFGGDLPRRALQLGAVHKTKSGAVILTYRK